MENRINQIMTLVDGKKYIVIKQAIYKNENYYAVAGVSEDEESLLEEYAILHELEFEGNTCVEPVEDPEKLKLITKYLGILTEEDWKELANQ